MSIVLSITKNKIYSSNHYYVIDLLQHSEEYANYKRMQYSSLAKFHYDTTISDIFPDYVRGRFHHNLQNLENAFLLPNQITYYMISSKLWRPFQNFVNRRFKWMEWIEPKTTFKVKINESLKTAYVFVLEEMKNGSYYMASCYFHDIWTVRRFVLFLKW